MSFKTYETSGYGHNLDILVILPNCVFHILRGVDAKEKIHLRHVCFIWFIFNILQLLPTRFTQQSSCCISKSMMKHLQKKKNKSN